MRAAVVAAVVFALVLTGLVLVAVDDPVTAMGEPTPQVEGAPTLAPTVPGSAVSAPCPQPGQNGPDLTGCPDQPAPVVGIGDLSRIEHLPPQSYP